MTVYVETNFVLELALHQEEHEACSELLGEAEVGRAQIVIPAFSLVEGWTALRRRRADRQRLLPAVREQVRTLSRSAGTSNVFRDLLEEWDALEPSLLQAEEDGMRTVSERILACATLVDLAGSDVREAIRLGERLDLRMEDAVVLAAVLRHLGGGTAASAVFLNRNSRDFATPDVRRELLAHGCEFRPSFADGLAFIRTRAGKSPA